jgi:hypothetical protein
MMKKQVLFIMSMFLSIFSQAQIVNFDNIDLDSTGVWNGSDLSGDFEEQGFSFENSYDTTWSYWSSGFAVSNNIDSITAGYTNMYSVISASSYSGNNFAISNNNSNINFDHKIIDGFYVNNSTYSSLSMLQGDFVAKKFGGESGNDEDWFKLSIIGYVDTLAKDTVDFYLADYRFEDNNQDYIVTDWTWIDLNSLGSINGLRFELTSSDNGDFGMNTPAFFCMDDFTVNNVGLNTYARELISLYPNPVKNQFIVNSSGALTIYNLSGTLVKNLLVEAGSPVFVDNLKPGVYFVRMSSGTQKIVKY